MDYRVGINEVSEPSYSFTFLVLRSFIYRKNFIFRENDLGVYFIHLNIDL